MKRYLRQRMPGNHPGGSRLQTLHQCWQENEKRLDLAIRRGSPRQSPGLV